MGQLPKPSYLTPGELAHRMIGRVVRVMPRYVAPRHAYAAPTYERDEWTYREALVVDATADGDCALTFDTSGATRTTDVWIRVTRCSPVD